MVSPAEAAGHTDVEPSRETELDVLPVNEQLSFEVSELGELSHQSDKAFRYDDLCTEQTYTMCHVCFYVINKAYLSQIW